MAGTGNRLLARSRRKPRADIFLDDTVGGAIREPRPLRLHKTQSNSSKPCANVGHRCDQFHGHTTTGAQ
jgi:hypothetical protein